jgi:hypothetical protein
MKNVNGFEVSWNDQKVRLKQKIAMLTDSDGLLAGEKQDEMLSRLEIKLGKTKEELTAIIAAL